MKQTGGIIGWCMRHYQITYMLVILMIVLGVYSLVVMPKQEFPEFTIRQGVVVAVYPGATSEQVEQQVAKPLERFLFTYKEIKKEKTYSMSRNGILYVMVELNDNVNNKDEVWSKIKLGLKDFKMQLPSGVLALMAKDDFGDTSAVLITLESDDKTYRELQTYLEKLEDQLRTLDKTSNLREYGLQNEQISISIDPDKASAYGVDARSIMVGLFAEGFTTTGGSIDNGYIEAPIYVKKVYPSELEVAEQIVYSDPNGEIIRLKDIATIKREYAEKKKEILNNGKRCVMLSMEMREGHNIVKYGHEVDDVLVKFKQTLPESVQVRRIADQPKVVQNSVTSFLRDLLLAILVVVLVMMFLFPFRSAVVAAVSIPISIFISLGLMYLMSIPLNTVTLAALIVVLGMIVDNSIIVVDAYLEKLDQGYSRWHAAISSAKDYFWSIFLATTCICIIFFPLLLTMKGMTHDFIFYFPFTLTITLMTSMVVAMVFIPLCEFQLIRKGLRSKAGEKKKKFNILELVERSYHWVLEKTFKYPRLTISLGFFTVLIGIWIFSFLPQKMMPYADRDQFAVEIYLPTGSSLDQTEAISDSVYQILKADDRVVSITQFNGMSSPRFQSGYAPNLADKNYAQFIVNTTSNEATKELLNEYTEPLSYRYPQAYVRFKELEYTTVATPLEVRFKGDNIEDLKKSSRILREYLVAVKELTWVHDNYDEPLSSVEVELDPLQASRLAISKAHATAELGMINDGITVGSVWEGDYKLPIHLESKVLSITDKMDGIKDQYITSGVLGTRVPLSQVAKVKPAWHEGQIVRRNGVRCLTVQALYKKGSYVSDVQKKIEQVMETKVKKLLPKGVTYSYGGDKEFDAEVMNPMMSGLLISVVIIFFFLV
ncbi:MAG: efflux RND transporter permease subunit, partial [Massilibacteroides sp.]|nr:efflux RND transporter permease subunit [Massilibacteroides sp.]